MKLHVDYKLQPDHVLVGYTAYDEKGSIILSEVQKFKRTDDRHYFTLKSLIVALQRIKQHYDNRSLHIDKLFIFTRNTVVYKWFENEDSPKKYRDYVDNVYELIDWLPFEVELIYLKKPNVNLNIKTKEEKTYSIHDFH